MRKFILIFFSLLLFLGGIFLMLDEGFSFQNLMIALFFGLCAVIAVFEERMNDWVIKKRTEKAESGFCIFDDKSIIFPKGYYFNYGFLQKQKELSYHNIDEVRINTHPVSAKINGNEIIFLLGVTKEKCQSMARKHKIPVTKPIDIWSLICDDFLDTEHSDDYKKSTIEKLKKIGITESEIKEIRKRISWRMLANTYLTLEWVYYGQFDVLLQFFPLNKKKYWWIMDIALRNENNYSSNRSQTVI